MSNITLPKSAGQFASARVLPDLTKAKPSYDDLLNLVMALQAKVDAKPAPRGIVKTSPKGCVAFTGVRAMRGGASFYPAEWLAIAKALPDIIEHIIDDRETSGTAKDESGTARPYTTRPAYKDGADRSAIVAALADILAKLA